MGWTLPTADVGYLHPLLRLARGPSVGSRWNVGNCPLGYREKLTQYHINERQPSTSAPSGTWAHSLLA